MCRRVRIRDYILSESLDVAEVVLRWLKGLGEIMLLGVLLLCFLVH